MMNKRCVLFVLAVCVASAANLAHATAKTKVLQLGAETGRAAAMIQEAGDVVLYHEDFENGPAGWVPRDLTEQRGVFWHPGAGVMECSAYDACFALSPGYGNNWVQDLTKTFSPRQSVLGLVQTVEGMAAAGTLRAQDAKGLLAKLHEAAKKFQQGDVTPALAKLHDFIDAVNALVRTRRLDANAAAELIDVAAAIPGFIASPRLEVTLEYNVEESFDAVIVQVSTDQGATFRDLTCARCDPGTCETECLTGISDGFVTRFFDLSEYAGMELTVRFRFTSDVSYSDEDGLWPSSGAPCRLDQVHVIGTDGFESGNDGWIASAPATGGSFRLEFDPPRTVPPVSGSISGNAWVAYDPQTGVVPSTPAESSCDPAQDTCLVPAGVAVHLAIDSPPIPIPAADEYFVEFDVYWDQVSGTGYAYGIPDVAAADQACRTFAPGNAYFLSPLGVSHRRVRVTGSVDPTTTSVILRLSMADFNALAGIPLGTNPGRGPYFDNVSLVAQGVRKVLITEIMYNPDSAEPLIANDTKVEWVEIYNPGTTAVDISGWSLRVEDGSTGPLPSGAMLAPQEAAVIVPTAQDAAGFHSAWGGGYRVFSVSNWGLPGLIGLSNTPSPVNEILTLRDAYGRIQDVVNYDDEPPWPSDEPDGPSIYLLPNAIDLTANDDGANWARSTVGVDAGRNNLQVGAFNGIDIGSPGVVATESSVLAAVLPVSARDDGIVSVPVTFALEQNRPNPFNPMTTIRFDLPRASAYMLSIYDVAGRRVRRYEGAAAGPERVAIVWDGTSDSGSQVGSGAYFYRVQAGEFVETRRMLLIK